MTTLYLPHTLPDRHGVREVWDIGGAHDETVATLDDILQLVADALPGGTPIDVDGADGDRAVTIRWTDPETGQPEGLILEAARRVFAVGDRVDTGRGRDYVWTFDVIARTAKFVTLRDVRSDETYRVGIKTSSWDGRDDEWCLPFGRYANAPVVDAR